jgi:hypothetical protein
LTPQCAIAIRAKKRTKKWLAGGFFEKFFEAADYSFAQHCWASRASPKWHPCAARRHAVGQREPTMAYLPARRFERKEAAVKQAAAAALEQRPNCFIGSSAKVVRKH